MSGPIVSRISNCRGYISESSPAGPIPAFVSDDWPVSHALSIPNPGSTVNDNPERSRSPNCCEVVTGNNPHARCSVSGGSSHPAGHGIRLGLTAGRARMFIPHRASQRKEVESRLPPETADEEKMRSLGILLIQ